MNKLLTLGLTLVSTVSLGACGHAAHQSTSHPTKATRSRPAMTSNNRQIAARVVKQFNEHGKVVTAKLSPEVVDDQSKQVNGKSIPHQAIELKITDQKVLKHVKTIQTAVDAGTASTEQKLYLAGIQEIITKAARDLKGQDTLSFGYAEDATNNHLIAASTKDQDLVKPVEITIE